MAALDATPVPALLATPGPTEYSPGVTRSGGGLLGDSPRFSFRGDSFPRSFLATAVSESSSPGPVYNPAYRTVARTQAPQHSFGTERRVPSPPGRKGGPGPNSYTVRKHSRGGGELGDDTPKFGYEFACAQATHVAPVPTPACWLPDCMLLYPSVCMCRFGTREQSTRPEEAVERVAYISRAHERENVGVFSPGPAAYSPRQSLHHKVHQRNSPRFSMRPHLKHKVAADGTTLRWAKISSGPGPGSSNPHVGRCGGGFMGDAPSHKIGTGRQCPNPASNFSPGPATYMPANRYLTGNRRKEGPSFSFGSAPRPCSTPAYGRAPIVSPRYYSRRRVFS
jgi:hypothetical protein